jgi:hypothetical protein
MNSSIYFPRIDNDLNKDLQNILKFNSNYNGEFVSDNKRRNSELVTILRSQTSTYYENSEFNWSKLWNNFIVKILNDVIQGSPNDINFGQGKGPFPDKVCHTAASFFDFCLNSINNIHDLQFGNTAKIQFSMEEGTKKAYLLVENINIVANDLIAKGQMGDNLTKCYEKIKVDLSIYFQLNMKIDLSCNCISPDSQKGENIQGWKMDKISIDIPKDIKINPSIHTDGCSRFICSVTCGAVIAAVELASFLTSIENMIQGWIIKYFNEDLNKAINNLLASIELVLPVQCNTLDYCTPPSGSTECSKPTKERFNFGYPETEYNCKCSDTQNYLWTPKDVESGTVWNVKSIGLYSDPVLCSTNIGQVCKCSGGIVPSCCKWSPNYYKQEVNNICNIEKVTKACKKLPNGWKCKFQKKIPDLLISTFNLAWPKISNSIEIGSAAGKGTLAPNATIANLIFQNEKILLNLPIPYSNTIAALSVSILEVTGLDYIQIAKGGDDGTTLQKFASDCVVGTDEKDKGVIRADFREVSLTYKPDAGKTITARIGIGINLNEKNHKAKHNNYMCPPGKKYPFGPNNSQCCSQPPVDGSCTTGEHGTGYCLTKENCVNPDKNMNICWFDYCKDKSGFCEGHGISGQCTGSECLSNFTCDYKPTENCPLNPSIFATDCQKDSTIFYLDVKINPNKIKIKADLEVEFQCCGKDGIFKKNKPMGLRKLKICNPIAEQIEILPIECQAGGSSSEEAICSFLNDDNVRYFINESLSKTWNNFIWPLLGDDINGAIADVMPVVVQEADSSIFTCPSKVVDMVFDPSIPNTSCDSAECQDKPWCVKAAKLCNTFEDDNYYYHSHAMR